MIAAILWTADRIAAIVGGAAAAVFLYVFFFGRKRPAVAARATEGGPQQIEIAVRGGYSPDLVVARRGVPLTLVFDRQEENPCSDEVVLPEFGIRRALPAFEKTRIEIVPERVGEYPFSCGMNMLHGKIRVVDS
jgi:plastocyanin domain-containing protein